MSKNSITPCWEASAFSDRVRTIIPSMTGVAQAGRGLAALSTSTKHMRQLAAIDNCG